MKRILAAAAMLAFAVASAPAEECKAVDKNGRALTGAAKTSHMKSCCRKNAVDKNGNPMKGIVKKQFVDKCVQGA
jgi:opacity protein-like surface antigen